jgi:pimeloyl-ACP methyl ester carboxylesterase
VQELAKSTRVFAYDLRGHGQSEKPAWGAHVARLAADLRDFMHALELDSVTGVGTSLGCAVIWSCEFLAHELHQTGVCGRAALAAVMTRWMGRWDSLLCRHRAVRTGGQVDALRVRGPGAVAISVRRRLGARLQRLLRRGAPRRFDTLTA